MSLPSCASHTTRSLYRRHMGDAQVSELFLPDHLRLGPWNWQEFKLAIEMVLRAKGIPVAHLKQARCPLLNDCWSPVLRREHEELWRADDEFCKAVVMLNVRSDHIRFAPDAHERSSAASVWAALEQQDAAIQRQAERDKTLLLRMCMVLAGMVPVLVIAVWRSQPPPPPPLGW